MNADPRLDRITAALTAAGLAPDAVWLCGRLAPHSNRVKARTQAITEAGAAWAPVGSARARAERLLQALTAYSERYWRRDAQAPSNDRVQTLHNVITAYGGRVPSLRTVEGAFAKFANKSVRDDEAA